MLLIGFLIGFIFAIILCGMVSLRSPKSRILNGVNNIKNELLVIFYPEELNVLKLLLIDSNSDYKK